MKVFWRVFPALALAVACSGGHVCAQVKLNVLRDGKKVGSAAYSHKLMPDGSKLVQLTLELTGPGGKVVKVRNESRYAADGSPLRKFQEASMTKPPSRRQITVTFTSEGANAVVDDGGARETKFVPLVKTAQRNDPSEFWFLRDRPKPGAANKLYRFDAESLSWVLTTVSYTGPKEAVLGNVRYKGHEVRSDRAMAIVDEKGLPIVMEIGAIRLERAGE